MFIIGFTPVAGMISNTDNRDVAVYNCKANIGRKEEEEVLKIEKKDLKFGKTAFLFKNQRF
jgi:hypothetical protein